MRSFQSWHSLHFLAQNIPVSSVVFENPSIKSFKKEIQLNDYHIVAIGFTVVLIDKVLEMATWLKSNFPKIEIVLGGYGTAAFKDNLKETEKLKN